MGVRLVSPNLSGGRIDLSQKKWATVITLAALTLLASCRNAEDETQAEVRPVRAITIETRAVGDTVALTGRVQAQTEINQSFRIDGRLIERTVDVGDTVRPGQLLARLDPQNEQSGQQAARAQLVAAQAQLVEARNNHQRMRDLVAENAVSRAAFDQAVALLQTAESQVEAVRANLALAENRLSYTRLFADVAGVVTSRGPEPGEVVSAGRMVVQVAREGSRDAVFDVPAQVKDSAPRNSDITVALVDDPKVTAAGKVREVSPRADPVTGTFAVRVQLIDPPPTMRLGSTVTGSVKLDAVPAIQVPAAALVRAEGGTAVWVYDATAGTVSSRSITVLSSNATMVQVASGLNNGDVVVVAGVQALRPGQKVRLLETTQS
jgi:RND family efflux transporter MFP subunit